MTFGQRNDKAVQRLEIPAIDLPEYLRGLFSVIAGFAVIVYESISQ